MLWNFRIHCFPQTTESINDPKTQVKRSCWQNEHRCLLHSCEDRGHHVSSTPQEFAHRAKKRLPVYDAWPICYLAADGDSGSTVTSAGSAGRIHRITSRQMRIFHLTIEPLEPLRKTCHWSPNTAIVLIQATGQHIFTLENFLESFHANEKVEQSPRSAVDFQSTNVIFVLLLKKQLFETWCLQALEKCILISRRHIDETRSLGW